MTTICEAVHKLFNEIRRMKVPFKTEDIPKNGVYVLFEKGERAHNTDRIVRVGTHTGDNQLPSRLKQHFMNENKDRSIFRKNIGRALLNKKRDSFLQDWEKDLTTRQAREIFAKNIDFGKQKEVEEAVTQYMRENFSFVVLPLDTKEKRLEIESKIISSVARCEECKPSADWLGKYSPKEKIRKSGLWLVNELYKEPLSESDIERLKRVN